MLTQERLKELLYYSPQFGIFVWKVNKGSRAKAGAIAGCFNKATGYVVMVVDNCMEPAHRAAFIYMTGKPPPEHTDHINGVRDDNRWCNLRAVTPSVNHKNRRIHKDNKSGFIGVCWLKKLGRWQAQIRVNYKTISLGLHDNKEDAIAARIAANEKYGFHENHGNAKSRAHTTTT